jgi:hypothetical protein
MSAPSKNLQNYQESLYMNDVARFLHDNVSKKDDGKATTPLFHEDYSANSLQMKRKRVDCDDCVLYDTFEENIDPDFWNSTD